MQRSLLDLPLPLRSTFFCAYLLAQLGLLVRAQSSPDFVFGFQMFNASSDMKISLFREVRRNGHTRLVPVRDGAWQVEGSEGQEHEYRWQDRVRDGVLSQLDRYVHASYGLEAQLYRLQFALRDVASHLPGDNETEALVAVVDTVKNGRQRERVRLREARR
ncbi:MAG: hypothetical protein ABUL62_30150 [Myxococcales bacterium]|jgi:hypothetical protein